MAIVSLKDFTGEEGQVLSGQDEIEQNEGTAIDPQTPAVNQNEKPTLIDLLKEQDLEKVKRIGKAAVDKLQGIAVERSTLNGRANVAKSACEEVGLHKAALPWAIALYKADDEKREAMIIGLAILIDALEIKPQTDWLDEVNLDTAKVELAKIEAKIPERQSVLDNLNKEIKAARKELSRVNNQLKKASEQLKESGETQETEEEEQSTGEEVPA